MKLDWKRTAHKSPDQIGYHAAGYSIWTDANDGPSVLTSGYPHHMGPIHTATADAAKIEAEAHADLHEAGQ